MKIGVLPFLLHVEHIHFNSRESTQSFIQARIQHLHQAQLWLFATYELKFVVATYYSASPPHPALAPIQSTAVEQMQASYNQVACFGCRGEGGKVENT